MEQEGGREFNDIINEKYHSRTLSELQLDIFPRSRCFGKDFQNIKKIMPIVFLENELD